MENKNTSVSGLSFCTVLGIVFIVLKLCKVIGWSWAWVLAPFWIPAAIGIVVFIIIMLIASILNRR